MTRIVPITDRSQVAPEHQSLVDSIHAVFGPRIPGPHSILLTSPGAEALVVAMSAYFRGDCLVKSPQRELVAVAVAREKDALYVWSAQVENARKASISETTIGVIRDRLDPSQLPKDESAIVTAVQQLLRRNRIDQTIFDALQSRYGDPWLVDLVALIGYFGLLTGIVNAFEVPADGGNVLPVSTEASS